MENNMMNLQVDKNYRMQIIMDDKAIKNDGIYDVNDIHNTIDKMMSVLNIIKGKNGWYYGSKCNKNYAAFMAIGILDEREWFIKYVKKWDWIRKEQLAKTGWVHEDWIYETNKPHYGYC